MTFINALNIIHSPAIFKAKSVSYYKIMYMDPIHMMQVAFKFMFLKCFINICQLFMTTTAPMSILKALFSTKPTQKYLDMQNVLSPLLLV